MKKYNYTKTSEAVTEGHPDKLADQISDAVLDSIIQKDQLARVACETLVGQGYVFVTGEITTIADVNISAIVRTVIKDVGYCKPEYGFDYETVGVFVNIHTQSPDIKQGVDKKELGAGDQGFMIGYASNETPELMPFPIVLSQKLAMQLSHVRKTNKLSYLRPDGKTQVTINYSNGVPVDIASIVVAAQHDPDVDMDQINEDITEKVIIPVCGKYLTDTTHIYINNTGRFVIGGPFADVGMTGRKIIADTYGSACGHGGGAFSGKDPTKVDKSGAYMGRYIAKNLVAAGMCEKCEVQLSYVIGGIEPLSLMVNTFGTGVLSNDKILALIQNYFRLSPKGMIEQLDLIRPIYRKTSCYGHFGRDDPDFTWEQRNLSSLFSKEV